ncbi:hypothetical protein HanOQP8_Chr11g0422111 [Helianthus annuus]|nr:hypothetical protein HanIR_Chr11g0550331 [Helianthus annuus]KAJ0690825.1 hypothetical protein HanOQP8_Chr11g0422111 [Helianthus annuus]
MVFDTHQGIITFTDPMFGDKYYMKTPQELIGNVKIRCSRYGWLLVYNLSHEPESMMLFNPFTNDIRKLQFMGYVRSNCFSAPPTSWDCMVVGLVADGMCVGFGQLVNSGLDWGLRFVDFGEVVPPEAPRGCPSEAQCFLVKCDEHRLLLVRVDEYGESVEVFKLNETTREWEKIDGLGRRMIYICGATCFCVEAKTPEMENKIYFPQLHSKNRKMVFYSLETSRYHTFDGRLVDEESFEDFLGTKYMCGLNQVGAKVASRLPFL